MRPTSGVTTWAGLVTPQKNTNKWVLNELYLRTDKINQETVLNWRAVRLFNSTTVHIRGIGIAIMTTKSTRMEISVTIRLTNRVKKIGCSQRWGKWSPPWRFQSWRERLMVLKRTEKKKTSSSRKIKFSQIDKSFFLWKWGSQMSIIYIISWTLSETNFFGSTSILIYDNELLQK